jgi:glycosyltransferase involved in cell wall biosynthesis
MKIYIEYSNTSKPYGGGNQFLNNLKFYLKKKNIYVGNPSKADIVLVNAFENFSKVIKLKIKFNNKIFVHRVDGVTRLYNNFFDIRDYLTHAINKYVADATIFQSNWCKIFNKKFGLNNKKYEKVILNSVNKNIFQKKRKKKNIKFKILASSWSKNLNKGFHLLNWLDENLNFQEYEFIFVGNSPVKFKNIKMIPAMKSKSLNNYLSKSDLYLSTSRNDACSNSILEAIASGLPVIALKDGGNPEIINNCGELYKTKEEIFKKIKKIQNNYKKYKFFINNQRYDACKKYLDFITFVFNKKIRSNDINNFSKFKIILISINVFFFLKISNFFNYLKLLKFKNF